MTRVRIDSDEWYPVYSIVGMERSYGHVVEVSDEQIARWTAATEAFEAAQSEMADLYGSAEDKAREEHAREKAEKEAAEKARRQREQAERQAAAADRERKRNEMWDRIRESGGHVYDADGNRIGSVRPVGGGVSTGVAIDPE